MGMRQMATYTRSKAWNNGGTFDNTDLVVVRKKGRRNAGQGSMTRRVGGSMVRFTVICNPRQPDAYVNGLSIQQCRRLDDEFI